MSATVKKDELLKAVADVLDEAIATYEQLEKMDLDMQEVQDPSKAKKSEPMAAPSPDMMQEKEEDKKDEDEEEEEEKKDMDKASLKMKKEEEPKEDEEEKDEEKEDEESDDKLMATYKSLVSKMEKRGLIKAEPSETKSMEKSQASEQKEEKGEEKIDALKKSFDERVEDLTKKIEDIAKAVESISKSPASSRRGLSGATPLRKSETENKPAVSKLEALDKLVELRKSGDQRVDTGLITRLEMGKLTRSDYERLNSILG